jgi:S-phase kinase-associated protein 1
MSIHKAIIYSSDKKNFNVSLDIIKLSNFLNVMINENISNDEIQEFYVNVNSNILILIIQFLEYYSKEPMKEIEKPIQSDNLKFIVQEWYEKFINVDMNEEKLFNLMKSSNYMDIKPLLDLSCAAISLIFRTKTPQETRTIFKNNN